MIFEAYGSYYLSRSGRVIISIPVGPNNLEHFREYIRDFKKLAEPLLNRQPWAILLIALKDPLTGPETENIMAEFSQWRGRNNCRYIAWSLEYASNETGPVQHQWVRIYNKTQTTEIVFFDTTKKALEWLKQRGYPCMLQQKELCFIESNKIPPVGTI